MGRPNSKMIVEDAKGKRNVAGGYIQWQHTLKGFFVGAIVHCEVAAIKPHEMAPKRSDRLDQWEMRGRNARGLVRRIVLSICRTDDFQQPIGRINARPICAEVSKMQFFSEGGGTTLQLLAPSSPDALAASTPDIADIEGDSVNRANDMALSASQLHAL